MDPSGLSLGFHPDLIKWEWYGGEETENGKPNVDTCQQQRKSLVKAGSREEVGSLAVSLPFPSSREESLRGRLRILAKKSKGNISWVETNCPPWGGGSLAQRKEFC